MVLSIRLEVRLEVVTPLCHLMFVSLAALSLSTRSMQMHQSLEGVKQSLGGPTMNATSILTKELVCIILNCVL